MFKSGLFLSAGNVFVAVLGLVRNILIARLVSVEDFGIASTFAITLALIEMTSSTGIEQVVVQDKEGEEPKLQSTAHAFLLVRGLLLGAILYLLAEPIAAVFGVPSVAWAYQIIAILPVIRGFAHLDMYRFQREMRFRPTITVELSAQIFSTLVAGALGWYLQDYRAMLWALLAQQLAHLAMSHVIAERSYQLGWDSEVVKRTLRFAWPVIINGFLLFGIFQGDRVIVANQMGISVLGWFAVAFALTLMPTVILGKVLNSITLPRLSKAREDPPVFANLATSNIEVACAIGVSMAMLFAFFGRPMILLLYGAKYDAGLSILVWLAVMQALRVAKAGPTNIAVSFAQTTNLMYANLARICFLPLAVVAAYSGANVMHLVWIAGLGELCALFVAFKLVSPLLGDAVVKCRRVYVGTLLMLAIILAHEMLYPIADGNISPQSIVLLIIVAIGYLVVFLPNVFNILRRQLVPN